jgi:glycosyltransferase involved in cell wall biosynthesis
MKVSVGVCAYNEESNIGKLLDKLVNEPLINHVVVVASGCTDRTVEIANSYKKFTVIVQPKREGKSSAVNLYLSHARLNLKSDICVLQSADTLPTSFTYKYLLEPFNDSSVGMVGGHPIPINDRKDYMGGIAYILWELHHQQSLINPKSGEIIAFRNVVDSIDAHGLVDEADIEGQILKSGYQLRYAPNAIVFNCGAKTVDDFVKQRKRIYKGHLILQSQHKVSTMNTIHTGLAKTTLKLLLKYPKSMLGYTQLELKSRKLASLELKQSGNLNGQWDMINSTKDLK